MSRLPALPRTVLILSAVSLLNDAASEMIAPLLPIFLTATLGAGPAVVGLIEGVAEATASLLKFASGRLADRGWDRKGLVVGGYALSNAARPLIGLAFGWLWVLLMRFLDRVGKGIRTAPRDAIIAGAVEQTRRGYAFGFHRAMDHAGAMVGPLLAFLLLQAGYELGQVFLLSVIPGLLVVVLLAAGVPPEPPAAPAPAPRFAWRELHPRLRALVIASAGLAFAAAPEVFLVLWAQERGVELLWVPLIWAAAHAVKMAVVAPAGALSDKVGRTAVLLGGWTLRVILLAAIALIPGDGIVVWSLFLGYAGALALTEGAERAMIGDYAPAHQKGGAFGLYHMLNGVLALPGALLFGLLWQWFGSATAFLAAALLTAVAAASLQRAARRM